MTIRQIRSEIEKLKKAVEPDPDIGIVILYKGELRDQESNICPESIVAINGRDASKLSSEKIQAMIDNAKTLFFLPDNGRDPDIWK
jgi:hypothetical protein